MATDSHELPPTRKIGAQPTGGCVDNAELELEVVGKDMLVDGVEPLTEGREA